MFESNFFPPKCEKEGVPVKDKDKDEVHIKGNFNNERKLDK